MGKNQENEKSNYDFDQLIRGSFGLSDEQLLEMMRIAEETISDDQIPPAPEDGFDKLTEELEKRGITPVYESEYNADDWDDGEEKKKSKKVKRLIKFTKVALIAAIVGATSVGMCVTVGARNKYEYVIKNGNGKGNVIIENNDKNKNSAKSLENAYKNIEDQLGVKALRMDYKPVDFKYLKTAINSRRATIYFDINGETFLFTQQLKTTETSLGLASDRSKDDFVYNPWLKKNIYIEKAITENGKEEYSAGIVIDNAYYYLSGITDEKTFKKIIEYVNIN